VTIWKEKNE